MSIQPSSGPVALFYSYAHKDEELRDQLDKHLHLLERQGLITSWHDREIRAGDNWANEIDTHLESAQIILLLISADFLASDYCYGVEMRRALERHFAGEARVIPIILRPVDWKLDPILSSLQSLPTDGKPVTTWSPSPPYDAAFEDIAQGIHRVLEDLLNSQYKQEQKVLSVKGITNPRLQEQRREACLRILISIRKLVLIVAEYRQMHDDLWVRLARGLNSRQHKRRVTVQFQSILDKLALAGSELSIDPNGKDVMDVFVAYMQAQARYIGEMTKPMTNPLTFAFGKADGAVLDALAEQANEQLSALEKVAQDFIQSS
jgi:TIR domain